MEEKFSIIKNEILGKKYSLSIACVDEKTSKKINKKYRKKNKPTNILSFSLSKNLGEIVLCPSVIKKEIKKFDRTFPQLLGFLVIHGMLHLKGFEHSSRMEELEQKYDQKYFGRNRRRLDDHASLGRRISKRRKKS
jgi:probable rRNA maturation factor